MDNVATPTITGVAIVAATVAGATMIPMRDIAPQVIEFRIPVLHTDISHGQVFFEGTRELRDEDFSVLTAADLAMLEVATSLGSDELDYSAFYTDDEL